MKNIKAKPPGTVYQSCEDHTVSGKKFQLRFDEEHQMLVTYPKPELKDLPGFYESAAYISHTDSRNSIIDKIYQAVKKYMLVKKLKWIERKIPGRGRILDIGAGTGDFLLEAKRRGWKVNGIEPNKIARKNALRKGIKLSKDARKFSSNKFDVITLWHVLEHVYDLRAQIIEIEHLLKKGGILIIAVPNYKSYDAQYYKQFWAAYDVPRHLWHFSQDSFRSLFAETSFKQTDSKPLIFDAFYVSHLSEKYKTGKPNFIKALYRGIKSNFKARFTSEYSSIAYFFKKLS